jgi:uncharacterized OsmC-like protein
MKEEFTARLTASHDEPYTSGTVRDEHELRSDEPEWLPVDAGDDAHPAPVDYLLTSLAACQTSVLRQSLERNGVESYEIECEAVLDEWSKADDKPAEMPPNTKLRIDHITVKMTLRTTPEYEDEADRCLVVYDEGCIVGQSLAGGIDYTPLTSLEIRESVDST